MRLSVIFSEVLFPEPFFDVVVKCSEEAIEIEVGVVGVVAPSMRLSVILAGPIFEVVNKCSEEVSVVKVDVVDVVGSNTDNIE